MCHTFGYKNGYIHISIFNGIEVVRVQLIDSYNTMRVKSVHAAKLYITRSIKGGLNE